MPEGQIMKQKAPKITNMRSQTAINHLKTDNRPTKTNQTPLLNRRQQIFIAEYLRDFNATKAAIRSGYSKKSAYKIGAENLRKPMIRAIIDAAIAEREAKLLYGLRLSRKIFSYRSE